MFNLVVLNDSTQPPTFESDKEISVEKRYKGVSYIDVTLVSPSLWGRNPSWNVRQGWFTSDHNAIEVEMSTSIVHDRKGVAIVD